MYGTAALISSVQQMAPDVKAFHLELDDESAIPFEPGGHLDVQVLVNGQAQTRSYSMFRLDNKPGFMIAVKRATCGRGGSSYMWSQRSGGRLKIRRARNSLPIDFSADNYVLIAGGIGVTPIIAAARALREAGKSIVFHYCIRHASSAPFLVELTKLLGTSLVVHESQLDRRPEASTLIARADVSTISYICGPLGLMEAVILAWQRRNLPRHNLRFETFANSGRLPTGEFQVLVQETGARVTVPENASMLDALLAAGQEVLYDCRRGECGLCKVQVDEFDGQIDHRDVFLSEHERALNNTICCCVSRVYGSSIVIRTDDISHGRSTH